MRTTKLKGEHHDETSFRNSREETNDNRLPPNRRYRLYAAAPRQHGGPTAQPCTPDPDSAWATTTAKLEQPGRSETASKSDTVPRTARVYRRRGQDTSATARRVSRSQRHDSSRPSICAGREHESGTGRRHEEISGDDLQPRQRAESQRRAVSRQALHRSWVRLLRA